ncbi:MAG: hypothetical protein OMM_12683 [Candidatus Magnetoglobus multicellularis str. Araruama]|uniref:DNA ligase (NAD(+)) n=1 Tax=Candidatus Magnetoglobus multicellularis str. Araruama TaxID=890399 RepID=A0A1V1NVE1_9BACT|nr:MAG: hypothetical protein OMM_12683 [Candidatus Magnetoglobus multicellularis str. Araruama]
MILQIFIYGSSYFLNQDRQSELLEKLQNLGFKVNKHFEICQGIEAVIIFCKSWTQKRKGLDYDIDGIVVKTNLLKYQNLLGNTAKSPRWAIAYKFAPELVETTITEITLQVGRTGIITPVAELVPVSLGGVVVKRATLHNQDDIERKKIDRGKRVKIKRAGEVIPEVVELAPGEEETSIYQIANECPVCRQPLVRGEGEAAHRCVNFACPAQLLGRLLHFVSKEGMHIEHIGPSLMENLIQKKFSKPSL